MTGTRRNSMELAPILLVIALLAGMLGQTLTGLTTGYQIPGTDDYISLGATIKTQNAADNIIKQGGIRGIDVSKYQGGINWSQVAATDIEFAFIRSTYGTTNDPYFLSNAKAAHENGIKVGAYHYATFKNREQMQQEAAHFVSRLKKVDVTYPAVLDLESPSHTAIKRSTLTNLAIEFMEIVKAEGYDVMLYSYNNFIRDYLDINKLSGYDLWIANYLEQPTVASHKVWQHTSSGRVSGIQGNVDINVAYQDLSGGGKIRVSKTVSDGIKATLNHRYSTGLPLEGLHMESMNDAIAKSLQHEIAYQWDADIPITGRIGSTELDYLSSIYWDYSTGGYITYLLQVKLFYKGYYKGEPTHQYDEDTAIAIQAFQRANNLAADGYPSAETWAALFA